MSSFRFSTRLHFELTRVPLSQTQFPTRPLESSFTDSPRIPTTRTIPSNTERTGDNGSEFPFPSTLPPRASSLNLSLIPSASLPTSLMESTTLLESRIGPKTGTTSTTLGELDLLDSPLDLLEDQR